MTIHNATLTASHRDSPLCGNAGRRALIRHWEKTLSEHRDGSLATVEWRSRQRFTSPVPAAMVELLSYLFTDGAEMPYSSVHKRLLAHMMMRVQYLFGRLEKAIDTSVMSSGNGGELIKNTVQRLTTMAIAAVNICDLRQLHQVIDRLVLLIHRCKVLQSRLHPRQPELQRLQHELCPSIYISFFGAPPEDEQPLAKYHSVIHARAVQCACTSHLPSSLTLACVGLSPSCPLSSLQNMMESSSLPALQQTWYAARPDRVLVQMAWHCYEVHAAVLDPHDGLHRCLEAGLPVSVYTQLTTFAESIGNCSALYSSTKEILTTLGRLTTTDMPSGLNNESGVRDLAEAFGALARVTASRPSPIKSDFYLEQAVEGCPDDVSAHVSRAFHTLMDAIGGFGDGTVGTIRLQLGLLCRKTGFFDRRNNDSPAAEALLSFAEKLGQPLPSRAPRPRLSLGAASPSRTPYAASLTPPNGLNIQMLSASAVRAFFVQRLPHIPLLAPSADLAAARTASKLDSVGDLWDVLLIMQSPIWTYLISAVLFESFLTPYSATSLRNDGRIETESLCAWLVLIAAIPLLVATVPGSSLMGHAHVLQVMSTYMTSKDSLSCSQMLSSHLAQREWTRARNERIQGDSLVKRRRNSPSATCTPLLTFEKLLEAVHGRQDPTSGVPTAWGRVLQWISMGENRPLRTVRTFFSSLQEVYDIIHRENTVEPWSNPKVNVRAVLGKMHQQFKDVCAAAEDNSAAAAIQVQSRLSVRLWRMLMVCLANYLLDGGWGGGGPGLDGETVRSLSSQDAFMLNYLLMEFRTEKFVGDGRDILPAAVLKIVQRLQSKRTPLCEAILAGNRQNLKELYCRWLLTVGLPHQGIRSTALRERLKRDLEYQCAGLVTDLKAEERAKMKQYIGQRRHDAKEGDPSICSAIYFLRYGTFKPPSSALDHLSVLFLGCTNS